MSNRMSERGRKMTKGGKIAGPAKEVLEINRSALSHKTENHYRILSVYFFVSKHSLFICFYAADMFFFLQFYCR